MPLWQNSSFLLEIENLIIIYILFLLYIYYIINQKNIYAIYKDNENKKIKTICDWIRKIRIKTFSNFLSSLKYIIICEPHEYIYMSINMI